MKYEDDNSQFIDDVCIYLYSLMVNENSNTTMDRKQFFNGAKNRLIGRGVQLVEKKEAQMKYDSLKMELQYHKDLCNSMGYVLSDKE